VFAVTIAAIVSEELARILDTVVSRLRVAVFVSIGFVLTVRFREGGLVSLFAALAFCVT
jgi:hypothetical protein